MNESVKIGIMVLGLLWMVPWYVLEKRKSFVPYLGGLLYFFLAVIIWGSIGESLFQSLGKFVFESSFDGFDFTIGVLIGGICLLYLSMSGKEKQIKIRKAYLFLKDNGNEEERERARQYFETEEKEIKEEELKEARKVLEGDK